MKRGTTWSYVIRVKDPETGESKPRWVGGFATEDDAKAARDEARVKARRGEYIDRNTITVAEYLDEWIEGARSRDQAQTLKDYRDMIRLYIKPRIGDLRLQARTPRRDHQALPRPADQRRQERQASRPRTPSSYVHAVLRKAFTDAVRRGRDSCPTTRSNGPSVPASASPQNRAWCGPPPSSGPSSTRARTTGCSPSSTSPPTPAPAGANCSTSAGRDVDLDKPADPHHRLGGRIDGQRIEGTTKSGRSRVVSIDAGTVQVLKDHRQRQDEERSS